MGAGKCLRILKGHDPRRAGKALRTSQLKIEDIQSSWTAFRMYQKGKTDFADGLLGATNR